MTHGFYIMMVRQRIAILLCLLAGISWAVPLRAQTRLTLDDSTGHKLTQTVQSLGDTSRAFEWPGTNGSAGQMLSIASVHAHRSLLSWLTIPIDSGDYIENLHFPFTKIQSAGFNINGTGKADSFVTYKYFMTGAGDGIACFSGTNSQLYDQGVTDGHILIGSTIGPPTSDTITPGAGINIVNGHNSITISSNGGDTGYVKTH